MYISYLNTTDFQNLISPFLSRLLGFSEDNSDKAEEVCLILFFLGSNKVSGGYQSRI